MSVTLLTGRMEQAWRLQRQGARAEARLLCEAVLREAPQCFDALLLLGVLAGQRADFTEAKDWFTRALKVNKRHAEAHRNRGLAHRELQEWEAAKADYDHALELNPQYGEAYVSRGNLFQALRKWPEALRDYDAALACNSSNAQAHYNRGVTLADCGRLEEALASYERANRFQPGYWKALLNHGVAAERLGRSAQALDSYNRLITIKPDLATAYANRGISLRSLKRLEAALADCDRAIALEPELARAHLNRGAVLNDLGQQTEALASFERAIASDPELAEARNNRAALLRDLDRRDEALADCQRALTIDPDFTDAYLNLGIVQMDLGQTTEAVQSFDQVISRRPQDAEAHYGRAHVLLLTGDYERGWPEHEWRFNKKGFGAVQTQAPLWSGEQSVLGKTILLHAEQGLGDTLQFCRYASLVADLGARVILMVQKPLQRLLESVRGVYEVLADSDAPPAVDFHCPMMSLPLAFKTTLATVPAPPSYLQSPASEREYWKHKLGERKRPRIGLVWSGGFRPQRPELWGVNRRRNVPLAKFAGFGDIEVDFVSLQKGEHAVAELAELIAQGWRGPQLWDYTQELRDFADTAGLVEQLDLIISVDTSTAHLAAAMGKPVWLMNRRDTCWRWLQGRRDSPWYPTLKLFRQAQFEDWDGVMLELKRDLVEHVRCAL